MFFLCIRIFIIKERQSRDRLFFIMETIMLLRHMPSFNHSARHPRPVPPVPRPSGRPPQTHPWLHARCPESASSMLQHTIHSVIPSAWSCFLSLAPCRLRLCSANHRAVYFSNLACDWLSIVWAYSKQETENGPWNITNCFSMLQHTQLDDHFSSITINCLGIACLCRVLVKSLINNWHVSGLNVLTFDSKHDLVQVLGSSDDRRRIMTSGPIFYPWLSKVSAN